MCTEDCWQRFSRIVHDNANDLFDRSRRITAARAPGRLDVMGGVADYSGSLVLEGTLAVATFAAVQARADGQIVLRSLSAQRAGWKATVEIPLRDFMIDGVPAPFESVANAFRKHRDSHWAAYAAGSLYVLLASGWLEPSQVTGVTIFIDSAVPLGAGVSSSASLEVAAMQALCGIYGIQMDGMELARLCQIVENRVVGAPCGIMDQVTCALGKPNALLRLLCRPHELRGYSQLPPDWALIGIDSGVKHSVGGSNYRKARTAAFMGLAIVQQMLGHSFGGYLCSLDADEWQRIRKSIPEQISGEEFTAGYGAVPDSLSAIEPSTRYRVRDAAEHPILEHARVQRFEQILDNVVLTDQLTDMPEAGGLMVQSHRSYSDRIDLGSPETDLLVRIAMELGSPRGVYGAKITGGGSGGTVAVLGIADALDDAADRIAKQYHLATGNQPTILSGTSNGAVDEGIRML